MNTFLVKGMSCAACQSHVEKAVSNVPGVQSVTVSLLTNSMVVEGTASPQDIITAVRKAGYDAIPKEKQKSSPAEEETFLEDTETPKLKKRLCTSIGLLALLMYLSMGHNMLHLPLPSFLEGNFLALSILQMLLALFVLIINKQFFQSGFRSFLHLSPNMDTLVALGSGVSFLWSLYIVFLLTGNPANAQELYHGQLYFESAAMIPALITFGKMLESFSKGKTTNALKDLIKLSPKTATIERDGTAVTVPIADVQIGDTLLIKPGETIPVDGTILEGQTAVDESSLTGESIPVDKSVGDTIRAATQNQNGFIKAKADRVGEDTTFAQIVRLVSEAISTKAPLARIVDRVSKIFVPTILGIALIVFLYWIAMGGLLATAIERAVSVLVVSCPCALGLATPVAITVGNGVGAKNGILFRSGEAIETVGKTKTVAFDKTGTITNGTPTVTKVLTPNNESTKALLELVYALEIKSEHPLAKAIVRFAKETGVSLKETADFKTITGNGLEAIFNDSLSHAGSLSCIANYCAIPQSFQEKMDALAEAGNTIVCFEQANQFLGCIAIADTIREDSASAIADLHRLGIETLLLTGDQEKTALVIGNQANIDHIHAQVLPDEKQSILKTWQEHGPVAMVGDGINDAPALIQADTGIAIGVGTDIAINSADIVLMNSRLSDVVKAIKLSKKTRRNIYENLFWAFAYNVLLIPMAAGFIPGVQLHPMWCAAAMSLSSFLVCTNALRLNLFENNKQSAKTKEQKTMKKTIHIQGMMCQHCENNVKQTLEQLNGIENATVSHETGTAIVTLTKDISDEVFQSVIEEKGYQFLSTE